MVLLPKTAFKPMKEFFANRPVYLFLCTVQWGSYSRQEKGKQMCVSPTTAAVLLIGTPFVLQGLFAWTEN